MRNCFGFCYNSNGSLHFKNNVQNQWSKLFYGTGFGGDATGLYIQQGKTYTVKFQMYIKALQSSGNSAVVLQYLTANNSGWNNNSNVTINKDKGAIDENASFSISPTSTTGTWFTVTRSFKADRNAYLGLYCYNTASAGNSYADVYIDDVQLEQQAQTTIRFNTNGGNELADLCGNAGTTIGTLPTPVKEGFTFGGWFLDSALTQLFEQQNYPEQDITLYAKWENTGIYTQDFESTLSVGSGAELSTAQAVSGSYSLHFKKDCPKPGNSFVAVFGNRGAIQNLQAGKSYQVTYQVYVESYLDGKVPVLNTQCFPQNLSAWNTGNKTLAQKNLTTVEKGKWVTVTQSFTPAANGYLGFWMMNTKGDEYSEYASVFVDDAALIEVPTVTVSFHTNGGNAVQPISGASGSAIALPSAEKQGSTFAGWYIDSVCKTPFTSAVFPEQNITLYAKWYEKGIWQQDFEAYQSGSGGGKVYTTGGATRYQKTGPNDTNVHGGEGSLYVPPENNSFFAMLFPYGEKLEKGRHYKIELWYKVYAMTNSGQIRLTYLSNRDNCTTWGENGVNRYMDLVDINSKTINEQMGVWRKQTVYFTAAYDAYAGLYTWGPIGFYLDDVTITETPGVTVRFETNGGEALDPVSGAIGESITTRIPTPQRADRSFGGWYLDSALTQPFLETTFTKNMTLYAKWLPLGTWYQDYEAYVATGNMTTTNFEVYKSKIITTPMCTVEIILCTAKFRTVISPFCSRSEARQPQGICTALNFG